MKIEGKRKKQALPDDLSTCRAVNHTSPGRSHRIGVTSDEAENALRLKVLYGQDWSESKLPDWKGDSINWRFIGA
jgi:hypothetical protein